MSRVQWIIVVSVFLLVAGALHCELQRAREHWFEETCQSSMSEMAYAMLEYAEDHDHRLPGARTWWSDIYPRYCHQDERCLKANRKCGKGYAMPAELGGADVRTIQHPERVVLLYEACNGVPEYRHRGGMNVAYANRHVEWIPSPPLPR